MDPQLLQARWQLDAIPSDEIPSVAANLLTAGSDTPALRALAACESPNRSDLQVWMDRYFREAGLQTITDEEARWYSSSCGRQVYGGGGYLAPRRRRSPCEVMRRTRVPETLAHFLWWTESAVRRRAPTGQRSSGTLP